MTVGWIYDRRFLDHETGDLHPERPERLTVIVQALKDAGLFDHMRRLPFLMASPEQLAMVHEPAYVDIVRMMCDEGFTSIGSSDTHVCTDSYDTAALAAGGVIAACNAVMAGTVDRAFCAVRPPGHHAESDRALGFCLFNNVAIGAEHLVRNHGLSRVAVVDFDVHHGNGTQHIFETRHDVLYISLHERPGSLPFPGTGEEHECGIGEGLNYTLNIPLSRGAGEAEYLAALDNQVLPLLDDYGPEFVLLSTGFDALSQDTVSHLSLAPESYGPITVTLVDAAQKLAEGRIVSVLEGGYDLCGIGKAVASHVQALS